jgi:outer membrane protein TolC
MIGHRPRRLLVVAAALAVAPLGAQAQPPAQPVTQQAAPPAAEQAAPPATQPIALSLEEALGLIPERSESVRIAAAGVDRAHGQLRQARSQLFPQLTGTVNYQRTLESQFEAIASAAGDGVEEPADDTAANPLAGISRIFASENTVTLGLQFSQSLFSGGRLSAQARASEAARRAAEVGVSSATAQARLDVTQAYFDALLADRLVAIAESSLVQTERTLRQTRLARQVGTTAEFDLLRAQVTRDNQRPLVLQARTQRNAALLRLRQLLEIPPARPLTLTTTLEADVPSLVPAANVAAAPLPARVDAPVDVNAVLAERAVPAELLAAAVAAADTTTPQRAPVRQAMENVRAQEQLLRVARGERLPAVNVSSLYQRFAYPIGGVPGLNEFFPNWTVSVGVSLPLLTGGRVGGAVQAAEASVAEARAQLRQAEELAALDAQLIVDQFEQAAAAYVASAGTAEQASRAYRIAEVRFTEGISTQVELDDSRLLQQQALANRAQAARDLNVARARLALLADLPLGAAQGGSGASTATQGASSAPGGSAGQQGTTAGGGAGFTRTSSTGGITP